MPSEKENIVSFLVTNKAIRFGDYTLKSGRMSPYFFDIGVLNSGSSLLQLGYFYADLIIDKIGEDFDLLFGPAYKGIPLAISTTLALSLKYSLDKNYFANRKQAKLHAEKGLFIGCEPNTENHKIIFIDDVFTTGDTKYETIQLVKDNHPEATFLAVIIGVDRKEKSSGDNGAIQDFERKIHVPVYSLISVYDILNYLKVKDKIQYSRVKKYLDDYGT